jgi:lipopolysaccharide export system protein LptA
MRKLLGLAFSAVMILSVVFVGEAVSSNGSLSVKGQTVTVKRKRRAGVIRKTGRGVKYVGRKTYAGGKYVGRKTYQGGKYVGKKTYQGTKWVGKKTVKGTRATISRAKKIIY